MHSLQPLGVEHIGLWPSPLAEGWPGLDLGDLEALSVQQLEEGNPVDPSGLDGDGDHAAVLELGVDFEQITGIGAEGADIHGIAVGGHADEAVIAVNIDGCGICVDNLHRSDQPSRRKVTRFRATSGHSGPPLIREQVARWYVPTRSGRRPWKTADPPMGSGKPATNPKFQTIF